MLTPMDWRYFSSIILTAFLLVTLSACQATDVEVEAVEKLEPVQIADRRKLVPIKFDRVNYKLRRGTRIGIYTNVPLKCYPFISHVFWNQGRLLTRDLEFTDIFFEELNNVNFNVIGDPKKMFRSAPEKRQRPEYLIGAQIDDLRMEVCDNIHWYFGHPLGVQNGTASIRIKWQVYSVLREKVVFETESRGFVKRDEGAPKGEAVLLNEVFAEATANLAADRKFVDFLKKKAPSFGDIRSIEDVTLLINRGKLFTDGITKNIDNLRHSVVTLSSGQGHGSGFFISPGLIMTNNHVIEGQKFTKVTLLTGRKILGEVLRTHPQRDVALVSVEAAGYRPIPIRMRPVKITEEVFAIGAPKQERGLVGTVSKGIVSRFRQNRHGLEDIQADVDIHGGNSGGPLLDAQGNIVGISYAGFFGSKKKPPSV